MAILWRQIMQKIKKLVIVHGYVTMKKAGIYGCFSPTNNWGKDPIVPKKQNHGEPSSTKDQVGT